MMGKKHFILSLILCVSVLSLDAQDNYVVRKIAFKGNKTYEDAELSKQITMHTTNLYERWIQKKAPSLYNSDLAKADVERLMAFYQSNGFLHVEISDSITVNEKKGKVDLRIYIKENEPVKVDDVAFRVHDTARVDADSLLRRPKRKLKLKKSNRFADNDLYADVSRLNRFFLNRGHVYSQTDFKLDLNPDSNIVDIVYDITPGIVCQFGETGISGNRYVKEKVIRRQLAYKTGDTYHADQLDKTRKYLYDLNLFRVVSVTPQTNKQTEENPVPVQVKIEEMPRITSKFGIGYGTEDSFRAYADVTYRGIGGGSSRLNLYAKHSGLTPYYISLTWTQPQFIARNISVSVSPYLRNDNEPGYNIQTIGLSFPLYYSVSSQIKTSLTYYIDRVKRDENYDEEFIDESMYRPGNDDFLYNKSGLSGSFTYNNAKPMSSPTQGEVISVGSKLNGYIFGSDFNYTKLWVDARKYQKMMGFTLALRAMIGGIYTPDEDGEGFIPVEDRFYSGGGNSNRGWGRNMVGPKRWWWDFSPAGGNSILETNVELRRNLFWKIEFAVFMDASNVWEESYHYRFNELCYATGGGIRISTPIGPIRFDVGVPLWQADHSPHYFLSVGEAF